MASQITGVMGVYSTVDERKHQSTASLAYVRGIHRLPVNSLDKGPVMQKIFPFDDVIMKSYMTLTHQSISPAKLHLFAVMLYVSMAWAIFTDMDKL